jgi:glycogen operon protein
VPHWARREGRPYPLGVTPIPADAAYNFALYSKHATDVTLELYAEADPATPIHRQPLDPRLNKSARI